jgi:hypothetical protein
MLKAFRLGKQAMRALLHQCSCLLERFQACQASHEGSVASMFMSGVALQGWVVPSHIKK